MPRIERPSFVECSWGQEALLHRGRDKENEFRVKYLVLKRDQNLSYHLHEHFSKTWQVVSGIGVMILERTRSSVSTGSLLEIPAGVLHTLRAVDRPLQLVEVQLGLPIAEEDQLEVAVTWAEIRAFLQKQV